MMRLTEGKTAAIIEKEYKIIFQMLLFFKKLNNLTPKKNFCRRWK